MTNPSCLPENVSFVLLLRRLVESSAPSAGWRIATSDEHWLHASLGQVSLPAQGWKLHVSASVFSAPEVLRRCVPILLEEKLFFKIAASPRHLAILNSGRGGPTQVGKFLTVYPADNQSTVRAAQRLDEVTRDLRAPRVPSSRPLRPNSLVHYRFGGFGGLFLQTPAGEIMGALQTPEGNFIPDQRGAPPPAWVKDPFEAAGVLDASSHTLGQTTTASERRCIANRFIITGRLDASPRGALWIALDLQTKIKCVLKEACPGAMSGPDGHDAQARLRGESEVLRALKGAKQFPAFLGLVEDQSILYLAMEDIEGLPLTQKVMQLHRSGQGISNAQIKQWVEQLTDALAVLHARNLVYRDLKSANVLVTRENNLRLIDLETAQSPNAKTVMSEFGTPGYLSPQQRAGALPSFADDIYALGAVLYFIITGTEPSMFPAGNGLLSRAPQLFKPDLDPQLLAILMRCLEPQLENRFALIEEVQAALEESQVSIDSWPRANAHPPVDTLCFRETARQLFETLAHNAVPAPMSEEGLTWRTTHTGGHGFLSRDLNIGSAGSLLAYAELTGEFAEEIDAPNHRSLLKRSAEYSKAHPRASQLCGDPLAGLYVGLAGAGAAILRAGQILKDEDLIAAACDLGRRIACLPHASPDLFNGTAGRLKFHLWLYDQTHEAEHLAAARICGRALLENVSYQRNEAQWIIPPGYGTMSGKANVGYSHGAAGIADSLLDLFEVTQDEEYLLSVRGAGNWLKRLAVSTPCGQGLNWPAEEGGQMAPPFWCHGATGIGWFFLHAAMLDVFPDAHEFSLRAATSVAHGARWSGPTFCHGLSGNIEFLLNVYQRTRDEHWRDQAFELAQLLQAWACERDGVLVFPTEQPHIFSPDYMVGYAGVALCFLRLADYENRPHQLSRAGFSFRAPAGADAEKAVGCALNESRPEFAACGARWTC